MQQLNCFLLLVNNHSQSVDYAATNNYTGAWQATPASPPKKKQQQQQNNNCQQSVPAVIANGQANPKLDLLVS